VSQGETGVVHLATTRSAAGDALRPRRPPPPTVLIVREDSVSLSRFVADLTAAFGFDAGSHLHLVVESGWIGDFSPSAEGEVSPTSSSRSTTTRHVSVASELTTVSLPGSLIATVPLALITFDEPVVTRVEPTLDALRAGVDEAADLALQIASKMHD
jgi:hypothetical protein